jgi:hypothetical protein
VSSFLFYEYLKLTTIRYATFVRIGTGLTIEDYDWVNKKKWIRMDKKAPPPHMKVSPSSKSEDKGDVYLDPEECVVLFI